MQDLDARGFSRLYQAYLWLQGNLLRSSPAGSGVGHTAVQDEMFQPGPLLREACQAWKDQQAGFVDGRWLDEVSHSPA